MLEVVQVQTLVVLCLLGEGYEEAYQEDGNDEDEESESVLESTPDALTSSLLSMLGGILVVFLVPEVGEGNDEQAQHGIERVEEVVDDAEGVDDAGDLLGCCPVLLLAQARARGGRDESDVDGDQQHRREQGESREDADNGDCSSALTRLLVDVDKGRGDEEEDADGDGIRDPDQAGLDERHGESCWSDCQFWRTRRCSSHYTFTVRCPNDYGGCRRDRMAACLSLWELRQDDVRAATMAGIAPARLQPGQSSRALPTTTALGALELAGRAATPNNHRGIVLAATL